MASRDFDIIIFGGTGYTGQYVIEELANSLKQRDIKWAIAGRNIQKLKESLDIVQKYIGNSPDISGIRIIQADVNDAVSILDMCKQGKLLLNCVGPYNLYGEVVVKACIEAGTHLVDINAEIKYSETMQAKYFMQAREKGVYIVGACGFGSVPADYGISLLKKEFPGDLNAVEYYFEIGVGSEGRKTNYGTYTSIIHSIKDQLFSVGKYNEALKKVFKKDWLKSCFPLHKRGILSYNSEVNGWCLWYLGPDERVIHRSQQFRYEYLNERPIQSNGYFQLPSFFISLGYLFFAAVVGLLSFFSCGLHILEKYPSFFTAGEISLTGPTRKQVMEGTTKFTLYGTGWADKLEEPTNQHTTQPHTKMKLTITGPEAGYVLTSMCMVQCGLTILEEQSKLPLEGGVLTPGVAFQNTSLRQRLEKRGMIFEFGTIKSSKQISQWAAQSFPAHKNFLSSALLPTAAMASRDFDIIIFGATGYTGRYVIEELAKTQNIKWAIAGRNIQKLKESLDIVQKYIGNDADIQNITIIQADIKDPESILNMCKRGNLILNCVGPYKFYGEVVVKACIEAGTHHVDLSGEMGYLETMQAKYFQQAREKGVYIVEACGFDSIPGDYGISLLKKEFPGDLNAVEYFVEFGEGPEGRKINVGTLSSAVHSFKDIILNGGKYKEDLKKEVFKKELPKSYYLLDKRLPLSYSSEVKGWCVWFMGPDERIIHRSQQFRYEYLNERPIQSTAYLRLSSFSMALCLFFFAAIFGFMSFFSVGRYLLEKYPSFFTAGAFSKDGPTRKQVMEGSTKFTLYGTGWADKLEEPTDQHTTQPDKKMKLTINGPDAGYVLTSMCMVHCGLTILEEKNKLPLEGGVLTPGVAFQNTSLRQRLKKRGMIFEFETIK